MVSAIFADALDDPTRSLLEFYDPKIHTSLDTFPAAVAQHFSQIFESISAFQEILPLDVRHPPEIYTDRTLVRFRCMVQDTSASPEMYLSKRSGGRLGGWGLTDEAVHGDSDSRRNSINYDDLKECAVIWATTIPGENDWCSDILDGHFHAKSDRAHRASQSHKFPVPEAPHVGAQIKIYGNQIFKSTEMVTFVGILTTEPVHAELDQENPTEVPTIHVLYSETIPSTVVPTSYPSSGEPKSLREELITWIADEALAGDRDAAEWILLTIIASVHSRTPPIMPPSLTLSRFPSFTNTNSTTTPAAILPTLAHIVDLILPMAVTIPLSLPTLNKTLFSPESKNEDLHSGWLQLPSGSTALITESGVSEGTLDEKGLLNIRAIQEMMTSQTIDYVFPYSSFSFPTNVDFIVLAEGKKSAFFQTSVNVTIKRPAPGVDTNAVYYKPPSDINLPGADKLAEFRALIGGAKSREGKINVTAATGKHIQDDFVQERQEGTVTPDDLIHSMSVARLLALSMHADEVTAELWERAKLFEKRRKERVS